MDFDKSELKSKYDIKHEEGKKKFYEYAKNNKIEEWVTIYLPFIDDSSKKAIIQCYQQIYNAENKCC